jgi:hypothetical protein
VSTPLTSMNLSSHPSSNGGELPGARPEVSGRRRPTPIPICDSTTTISGVATAADCPESPLSVWSSSAGDRPRGVGRVKGDYAVADVILT